MLKSWTENYNRLINRSFSKQLGIAFGNLTYEWLYRGRTNKLPLSGICNFYGSVWQCNSYDSETIFLGASVSQNGLTFDSDYPGEQNSY